jgi:hypothetical protein
MNENKIVFVIQPEANTSMILLRELFKAPKKLHLNKISSAAKIPANSEIKTCFDLIAKKIAISGGKILNIPNSIQNSPFYSLLDRNDITLSY